MYVKRYQSKAAAAAYAHSLAAEDVATAGLYAVSEAIAPYSGSPIPPLADCLNGKPIKGTGRPKIHGYTF